jgi:hypothetical protein
MLFFPPGNELSLIPDLIFLPSYAMRAMPYALCVLYIPPADVRKPWVKSGCLEKESPHDTIKAVVSLRRHA